VSGAEDGAERAENQVERSGRGRKRWSGARSAEQEVSERERSVERAESAAHTVLGWSGL